MNALMAFPASYKRGRSYKPHLLRKGIISEVLCFFVNFTMIYIVIESFTIARLVGEIEETPYQKHPKQKHLASGRGAEAFKSCSPEWWLGYPTFL